MVLVVGGRVLTVIVFFVGLEIYWQTLLKKERSKCVFGFRGGVVVGIFQPAMLVYQRVASG